MPVRRLVVWCPDWPVVAAAKAVGLDPRSPAAVFIGHRVVACSMTARENGVCRGMRRREAQSRCPDLIVFEEDVDRDARLFESVAGAVETIAPGVEIVRPGVVAVPAGGPVRYFGTEESAAERVVDEVEARADVECQVGIGDGLFPALLAARRGTVVEPGGGREFLAPLPIEDLDQLVTWYGMDQSTSVDLLRRLGMRTLGQFAELSESDVANRFGATAVLAHRAANGREERPPKRREPTVDLSVTERFEPALQRVDAAAFAAKTLADQLHAKLRSRGVGCTRLGIMARTEHAEQLLRVWRCAEPLTAAGTADRVRWQLDGWLTGKGTDPRPTAGVRELRLSPEEVVDSAGLQLDLTDFGTGEADDRAGRAFVRVLGMLGPEAVLTGVLDGGRDARDRVRWVPWSEPRRPALDPGAPWPGRIPPPSPSVVPQEPWPVTVLDEAARSVEIDDRNWLSAVPRRVVFGTKSRAVSGWAGPWPIWERWWSPLLAGEGMSSPGNSGGVAHPPMRAAARLQVVLAPADPSGANPGSSESAAEETGVAEVSGGEAALLLAYAEARWWVQGAYR